jgi:transposase
MQRRAYIKRTKLSNYKIKQIVRYFLTDLTATQTGKLLNLNRNTVNRFFNLIRDSILNSVQIEDPSFSGEVELDESYFGPTRVKGKRGRGAGDKVKVFGILKRQGKVHIQVVENCSRKELMPIIKGKILQQTTVYTDGWKAYDSLITEGYEHYRIFHSEDEFARGKNHVNGVESFWGYAKHRLQKFKGFKKENFYKNLKECEWRFNHRHLEIDSQINIILTLIKRRE